MNTTKINSREVSSPNKLPKTKVKIYVSIVSHGHESLIISQLKPHIWNKERPNIVPLVISNMPSPKLKGYCEQHNLYYSENKNSKGFGENNNIVFKQCEKHFSVSSDDYFFLINPDIITCSANIEKIAKIMESENVEICAPNLINEKGEDEDNIRTFPDFFDCLLRWILKSSNSTVNKNKIKEKIRIDWAAGAFLCFKASVFRTLNGFDTNYFMYYEDADICRRAKNNGIYTYFIPQVSATHIAARESRKTISRLTITHIKSALRFLTSN